MTMTANVGVGVGKGTHLYTLRENAASTTTS